MSRNKNKLRPDIFGQTIVPVNEQGEFIAKRRRGNRVPFGYIADKHDPQLLIPDPDLCHALLQAFEYMDQRCSSRSVAGWLSAYTYTDISHVGLFKKYKDFKAQLRKFRFNRSRGKAQSQRTASETA